MSEFLLKRQLKFSSTAVMASPHVSRKDRVSVCRLKDRTLLQLKPSQDQQVLWTTRGVIGLQMGPPSQHMREWLGTSTGSGSSPEPSPRRPNTCKLGTKLSFFSLFLEKQTEIHDRPRFAPIILNRDQYQWNSALMSDTNNWCLSMLAAGSQMIHRTFMESLSATTRCFWRGLTSK